MDDYPYYVGKLNLLFSTHEKRKFVFLFFFTREMTENNNTYILAHFVAKSVIYIFNSILRTSKKFHLSGSRRAGSVWVNWLKIS